MKFIHTWNFLTSFQVPSCEHPNKIKHYIPYLHKINSSKQTPISIIIPFLLFLSLQITPAPENRRNVSELYKRMSVAELQYHVPKINWVRYLSIILSRPVSPHEPVVNFALRYCEDLVQLLHKTPPRQVSRFHFLVLRVEHLIL